MDAYQLPEVRDDTWERAFRTAMAHHRMMESARSVRGGGPELPPLPLEMMVLERRASDRVTEAVMKRGKKRLGARVPREKVRKKAHPLVGELRGCFLPWVWGAADERMGGLIGMTSEAFREHIAAMFEQGMSWANHGYWHLDHILPVVIFDHNDPIQVRACWHYSNFQPLWGRHNLQKGKKVCHGKNTL